MMNPMREALNKKLAQANLVMKWALKSEGAARIKAMIDMARDEVAVQPDQFDQKPWLLNCPNGTFNLQAGKLQEHRQEDYLTTLCPTPVDMKAEAPRFVQFMAEIFNNDQEVIRYVQKLLGYCLTGDVREQILAIFWGAGANGKSVLINTIFFVLGDDFAIKANRDLFMAKKGDSHPAQMARLFGKRLVVCIESAEGGRLDEALVKELTGGDRIAARRMREDWWEFDPTHKAILVTNHRPEVRGGDHAIWRRLRLIPFTVTFPEERQDKQLNERLKAEARGILRWLIEGCLAWQKEGLGTPAIVMAATEEYQREEDGLGEFLAECCVTGNDYRIKKNELFPKFAEWCKRNGRPEITGTRFGLTLRDKGIKQDEGRRWYIGVALRHEED